LWLCVFCLGGGGSSICVFVLGFFFFCFMFVFFVFLGFWCLGGLLLAIYWGKILGFGLVFLCCVNVSDTSCFVCCLCGSDCVGCYS